jgi:small-conductance mechanosensitive channel
MTGSVRDIVQQAIAASQAAIAATDTYVQLGAAVVAVLLAWMLSARIAVAAAAGVSLPARLVVRGGPVVLPALTALLLMVTAATSEALIGTHWLLRGAVVLALLWTLEAAIRAARVGRFAAWALHVIGVPILVLHLLGWLSPITSVLASMSVEIGSLRFTAGGVLRVLVFGSLLFWLGWISIGAGVGAIRRQQRLDPRMREVVAKLFQIGVSVLVILLILQVMDINLTALAVFGGAVGVGLGIGLQAIASNFISGIIILFDRSLSIGDYIEIEGGQAGYVRDLTLRYTTLEGFDGKSVLVPNETFITKAFTNWTHKDRQQRYRVDFSVAYDTDIRKLCQLIRETVARHPQVISGEQLPIEMRPDCEIASFGESGVNMFVEFWMEGIDDGPNRVGGDLLLMIFDTLREHGIQIPFPQREVRVLGEAQPPAGSGGSR